MNLYRDIHFIFVVDGICSIVILVTVLIVVSATIC